MGKVVSKEEYQQALDMVDKFQERENKLKEVEIQLANFLSVCKRKNKPFNFYFEKNTVIFSWVNYDDKIKIGISKCNPYDKYNKLLGKAIAVWKARDIDIKNLVELVESKNNDDKEWVSINAKMKNNIVRIEYPQGINIITFDVEVANYYY